MPVTHLPPGLPAAALGAVLLLGTPQLRADEPGFQVVGRQGILVHVIVPAAAAKDRAAYLREIPVICGSQETCFVNFYTNSTGAPASLPLPDAISSEATAVLRRSAKQGSEGFRWSCRLALPEPDCF